MKNGSFMPKPTNTRGCITSNDQITFLWNESRILPGRGDGPLSGSLIPYLSR